MIIDLTHTITKEMSLYPDTPVPDFSPLHTITRDGYRETSLTLTSHTGTHMDAPSHLLRTGSSLDQLPLSQFCGRAVVLDVSQAGPVLTAEYLQQHHNDLYCVDFVLFYTGWEQRWGTERYLEDAFPAPDEDAARYLVSCGLKGAGTDAVSVDRLSDAALPVHTALLKGGLVILESLCLKKVRGRGHFQLYAPPLKFDGADGAPVRAIAELRENFEKEKRTL